VGGAFCPGLLATESSARPNASCVADHISVADVAKGPQRPPRAVQRPSAFVPMLRQLLPGPQPVQDPARTLAMPATRGRKPVPPSTCRPWPKRSPKDWPLTLRTRRPKEIRAADPSRPLPRERSRRTTRARSRSRSQTRLRKVTKKREQRSPMGVIISPMGVI